MRLTDSLTMRRRRFQASATLPADQRAKVGSGFRFLVPYASRPSVHGCYSACAGRGAPWTSRQYRLTCTSNQLP